MIDNRRAPLLALTLTFGACALFGKSEPLEYRYYSLEPRSEVSAALIAASDPALALRFGRILAAAHLRERVAFKTPAGEVGFYDERRWTERPEAYLERALSRALFEQAQLTHVVSGPAPTLDVEILDFTELRAAERKARVSLRVLLSDGRTALLERTLACERKVAGAEQEFSSFVEAMTQSLEECVQQIRQATLLTLQNRISALAGASAPDAGVRLANEQP